tara:strand:+ start:620 stop:1093 length:474 start_codon:yes stop_codon:yes gene_type:complete
MTVFKGTNHVIGIDPGKSGGIARVIQINDEELIWTAHKCPENIKEMDNLVKIFKKFLIKPKVFIESVHAFPTDGRSSAFKFGMNYGIWQGIIAANNLELEFVTPQKWQKHFGKLPKDKKERKNILKKLATDKTNIKATLSTADAILIAVYGYEYEGN